MGMTYHDNEIDISVSPGEFKILSGSYTISDFSVSSGQDPNHNIKQGLCTEVILPGNSPKSEMHFSVGRHATSQVARWVKNQLGSKQSTMGSIPNTLNFAFIGQLKYVLTGGPHFGSNEVSCVFDDIVLAQGHQGTANIWLFGGRNCTYYSKKKVTCRGVLEYGFRIELLVTWSNTYYFSFNVSQFEVPLSANVKPPPLN